MIDANISCETVHELLDDEGTPLAARELGLLPVSNFAPNAVTWTDATVITTFDDRVAAIDRQRDGISRQVLKHLITERKKVDKKSSPGWTFKIGTNSLYGAMGARTSGLHTRLGAMSVTLIGRWLLTLAVAIAPLMKLRVVYGDTD